jgi:hypothetical protein
MHYITKHIYRDVIFVIVYHIDVLKYYVTYIVSGSIT